MSDRFPADKVSFNVMSPRQGLQLTVIISLEFEPHVLVDAIRIHVYLCCITKSIYLRSHRYILNK